MEAAHKTRKPFEADVRAVGVQLHWHLFENQYVS